MLSKVCMRHSCILSLHLFNIYSEQVMRNALEDFTVGGKEINDLRYVDDVVLIAGSVNELQELVNRVRDASIHFGLS